MTTAPRTLALLLAALAALAPAGCETAPTLDEPALRAQRHEEAMALIEQAERHADAGRADDAIAAYQEAIAASPRIAAAWNNLGELLMQRDRYADAVSAFDTAANLEPGDPRPLYNAGVVYQKQGWAFEALKKFELALGRESGYLPALRGAVRSAEMLNRADTSTLTHIRNASLIEADPVWRDYFQRQRFRVEAGLRSADAD